MLTVLSSTCLMFAACALLYQADARRSAVAGVRGSQQMRYGMRTASVSLLVLTLFMVAALQGWELGIPVWLGLFSFAFVAGLYLSSQKPEWHLPSALAAAGIGGVLGIGALLS